MTGTDPDCNTASTRRAFFGQLHIHTVLSYDAWSFGTKVTPAQTYAFAAGQAITVPQDQLAWPMQQGMIVDGGVQARRPWPLDFMAITDHAEGLGINASLEDPESRFAKTTLGQRLIAEPGYAVFAKRAADLKVDPPLPPEWHDAETTQAAWDTLKDAAREHDKPGVFTTFLAFEWTSMPQGKNLHRNVIFSTLDAPVPFSAAQSMKPEALWSWMEDIRAGGQDVIAIPHNGNLSDGLMYGWDGADGQPMDAAYAQRRAWNEPLTEIAQIKGQSETVPALSPQDEFAGFEVYDHLLASGVIKSQPDGSYIRHALGRGLAVQARTGVNPYHFGVVGGSDLHNGLSVEGQPYTTGGDMGGIDPATMLPDAKIAKGRIGLVTPPTNWDVLQGTPLAQTLGLDAEKSAAQKLADATSMVEMGSSGLTGIWAEENTRPALFAAMRRKETFATSGSRLRLRMFGCWDFDAAMLHGDWVAAAYLRGVPMGGVLPPGHGAPGFIVEALKDPDGANLDRLQVVKVWAGGEAIFDVALSAGRAPGEPLQGKVDLATATYDNSIGAERLLAFWRDDGFDPAQGASYYLRALEIPTPRWSTILAAKWELPLSPHVPPVVQSRAWSSPITIPAAKGPTP